MAGISCKAMAFGEPGNKFKYNGKEEQRKEFADGSGLEWMDYGARMYDGQIGRWMVSDPFGVLYESESLYQYVGNNPCSYIDYEGRFKIRVTDGSYISLKSLARFKSLLRNIKAYLQQNSDIVSRMVGITGLSKEKIFEYVTYGKGPTIVLSGETRVSKLDFMNNEIQYQVSNLEVLGSTEFTNSQQISIYAYANLMLVLHELCHFGDRETNDNNITGQTKGDLEFGKQKDKKSWYGHRGTDLEEYIMYNGQRPKHHPYTGIAIGEDGILDSHSIPAILASLRYSESLAAQLIEELPPPPSIINLIKPAPPLPKPPKPKSLIPNPAPKPGPPPRGF